MKGHRLTDWLWERALWLCGVAAVLMVAALFYYLAAESRFAFERKFPYGFRFALEDPGSPSADGVGVNPYNSFLGAHPDGQDGVDEKEEGIFMPSLEELRGSSPLGTGTTLGGTFALATDDELYRDDWRTMKPASQGDSYALFAFATPEYGKPSMKLRWEPDAGFEPGLAPFDFKLLLVRSPEGVQTQSMEIDLSERPSGSIELPTYVARTDADRTRGWVFQLEAIPRTHSNVAATLQQMNKTEWAPTNRYPQYGFWPLISSTLLITLIALLIALPPSFMTALFLSELAPPRVREWLKPIVELLASVPTVVLGYFGLMLVAPGLMNTLGEALQLQSGRCLLTAAIVMSVLIAPVLVSVAEDALRAVPQHIRDGAAALGLSPAEIIRKALLPAARTGLIAATLLGFARAIGETMIVWILSGGTALMPKASSVNAALGSLVQPTRGVPDTIGIELANVEFELPHYGHLFVLGVILFSLTTLVNLTGYFLTRRSAWQRRARSLTEAPFSPVVTALDAFEAPWRCSSCAFRPSPPS